MLIGMMMCLLAIFLHQETYLQVGKSNVGTHVFYLTQDSLGCTSSVDSVTLTIDEALTAPIASNVLACISGTIPDLVATAANDPHWYNDSALTNLVHRGSTYSTGLNQVGAFTFYVADSSAGCGLGPSTAVVLEIFNATPSPIASDTSICFGDPVPDLTANGSNLRWYDDIGLTNLVGTGGVFASGVTAAGIYTYYVTDSLVGLWRRPPQLLLC